MMDVFKNARFCLAISGLILSLGIGAGASAANGPSGFSYEGRLYDSSGNPSTATVQLTLSIYNPAGNCLLRSEQMASLDLSTTNGYFSVTVGQGTATAQDPGLTMTKVFANNGPITGASSCVYTPQTGDGRLLRVQISDGQTVTTLSPDVPIGASPYAVVADTIQGKAPTDFVQVNSTGAQLTQANLESVFSSAAAVSELVALATGTSTRYARATTSSGIAVPVFTGTPATPVTGQMWYDSGALKYWNGTSAQTVGVSTGLASLTVGTGLVDGAGASGTVITSSGTIKMPNVGTVGTYYKVTTDAQGRVASGSAALGESDLPNLTTAGKVSGGAISSGTIGGTTAISTSGNLQTSGDVTAKRLYAQDSGTNYAGFKAPTTVTTTYSLVLPNALPGTNGQVLASDTAGNLSWVTPSAGGVSTFSATAPLSNTGTASAPVVTIAQATGATDGYLSSADWNTFNNKLGTSLLSGKIYVGNASNVATALTPAGDVTMTNAGLFTVGKIQGTAVSATAPTTAGQVLRYDGTSSYVASFLSASDISGLTTTLGNKIDASQMPANCSSNQTLTFSSPTGVWTCTTISGLTVAQGGTGSTNGSITGTGALTLAAGSTNQNITLSPSGTGSIIMNGNVGIGTTFPVASLDLGSRNDAMILPRGTTAQRPVSPSSGWMRYNTTNNNLEFYDGTTWSTLNTGSYVATSGGTMSGTLTVSSGGLNVGGGINNNSGGITNAGPITGVGSSITGLNALTVAAGGTNQLLSLMSSGSGAVNIGTGNGPALQVVDAGGAATNAIAIKGGPTGVSPSIAAVGGDPNVGLSLVTKGTGNLVIPTGRVGIGTTSPGVMLDILSPAGVPNNVNVAATDSTGINALASIWLTVGGSNYWNIQNDATGFLKIRNYSGVPKLSINPNGGVSINTVSSMNSLDVAGGMALGTFAGTSAPVNGLILDGPVGVGISSPTAKLHVFEPSADSVARVETGGSTAQAKIYLSNAANSKHWFLANKGATANNSFVISDTGADRFLIDGSTGNVGIGTTSPSSKFSVVDNSGGGMPVLIQKQGATGWSAADFRGNAGMDFTVGVGNTTASSFANMAFMILAQPAPVVIGNNNVERMRIDSSGRVGIGTTNPRQALDVNGAIVSAGPTGGVTSTYDFSAGNIQFTTNNCMAFALYNLQNGGSYTFIVKGSTPSTCSFTAYSDNGVTPLNVRLPPDHGQTIAGKHTVYSLQVAGGDVYVSWMPGY